MKIKAHNLNTAADVEGEITMKNAKIVSRQHLNKSKTLVLKENIPPQLNVGDKKKTTKNTQQAQKSMHTTQSTLRIRAEKEKSVISQYEKQIMTYIKSRQSLYKIQSNYLRNHEHVTQQVRNGFVKYFFKVGKKFQLKRTTIFLAVYYLDAFLEKNLEIQKREAIIIAQACLFIAMKYEQIYPPQLYELTQSAEEVIMAQALIMKALDFNLAYSSIQTFLDFYFSKLDIADRDKEMIKLVADVSLFDTSMYGYNPCQLSSAIIYSIVNRAKLDEKIQMSLKWMMERNQKHMEWLQTMKLTKKKNI